MQIATVTNKATGQQAVLSIEDTLEEFDFPYTVKSTNPDLVIHNMGFYTKTQIRAWIEELYSDDEYFEVEFK